MTTTVERRDLDSERWRAAVKAGRGYAIRLIEVNWPAYSPADLSAEEWLVFMDCLIRAGQKRYSALKAAS